MADCAFSVGISKSTNLDGRLVNVLDMCQVGTASVDTRTNAAKGDRCTVLLRWYRQDRNFLDKIITMDETWVHHSEPESNRQSSVWKTPYTPPLTKAKAVKSIGKVIAFMDNKGTILSHAVRCGETVNAEYYFKVVRRDLMKALRKKQSAMAEDIENLIYHNDNAPSHTAESTDLELALLGFQRIWHSHICWSSLFWTSHTFKHLRNIYADEDLGTMMIL